MSQWAAWLEARRVEGWSNMTPGKIITSTGPPGHPAVEMQMGIQKDVIGGRAVCQLSLTVVVLAEGLNLSREPERSGSTDTLRGHPCLGDESAARRSRRHIVAERNAQISVTKGC